MAWTVGDLSRSILALGIAGLVACGDDLPSEDGGSSGSTGGTPPTTGTSAVDTTGLGPGSDGTDTGSDTGPLDPSDLDWPTLDCDPIAPAYCAFPFPSNVFTSADATSPTGRRLQVPTEIFTDGDPEPWSYSDGFSPSAAIMVYLPGGTADGLPGHADFDASLAADSPTVLLDAESGERIAHFAELDYSANDPERRALMIRPAARLPGGRRYLVALRNIVDSTGAALSASPGFTALRDGTDFPEDDSIEARRALYGDIFYRLGQAGVERDDLQLAWDFTTATDENLTGWLLHMRDETFADLGPTGAPTYTLDVIDTEWNTPDFLYRIEGTFQAPLYLEDESPLDSRLRYGDDGMPEASGTMDVEFWLTIPASAQTTPAAIVQHGHGLLGSGAQIESSHFREVAMAYNYAFLGVDWIGMSGEDEVFIGATVSEGRTDGLAKMTDRMHQGALNQLLAMRLAWAALPSDPLLVDLLDPDQRYYYGISQGGILGGVYMATTTEVERGVLDVPGQPYNILLTRSVDFDMFFELLRARFPDPLDIAYTLGMFQVIWDRVEPTGYTHRIRDPLPGTPTHEVLLTAALGDHQVSTLGAHHMARSIGAVHLDTQIRDIWGLDVATDSHTGSALAEYEFGLPDDPACNVPQTACEDPHGKLRRLDSARAQLDEFLRTGVVVNHCPGGACSYPTEGNCAPGERTPDVCN